MLSNALAPRQLQCPKGMVFTGKRACMPSKSRVVYSSVSDQLDAKKILPTPWLFCISHTRSHAGDTQFSARKSNPVKKVCPDLSGCFCAYLGSRCTLLSRSIAGSLWRQCRLDFCCLDGLRLQDSLLLSRTQRKRRRSRQCLKLQPLYRLFTIGVL